MRQRPINTEKLSLDDVGILINRGRWRRALRIVRDSPFELAHRHEQRYWFLRALAELLAGNARVLSYFQRRARSCPDYASWIEGDFLRDYALYLVRKRLAEEAAAYLNKAKKYHQSLDRQALFIMCLGAVAYAAGDFQTALMHFEEADKRWLELKIRNEPANDQWIKNNRFRLLKAQARLGCMDKDIAKKIRRFDPSFPRRCRARFIWYFGTLGNAIDDYFIFLANKRR